MYDVRILPSLRSQDLAEADQFPDSATHLEPDPEQSDESQSDETP